MTAKTGRRRTLGAGLALASAIALAACSGLQVLNAVVRNPDGRTERVRDLPYGDHERLTLDLYVPHGEGPFPVLMFVHGGSWRFGSKDGYPFVGERFAAEGFLTAVIDYRLVPEGAYPAMVEDAAAAAAWLIENAGAHKGDPERLYLVGHSAGAYNVVMAGLAEEFLEAEGLGAGAIDGVIGLSGPYRFNPKAKGALADAFGDAPDPDAVQPLNRARGDAPPLLLVTGDADRIVSPANASDLAEAVRAAGGRAETRVYEGGDHNLPVVAIGLTGRAPVVDDITTFIRSIEGDAE